MLNLYRIDLDEVLNIKDKFVQRGRYSVVSLVSQMRVSKYVIFLLEEFKFVWALVLFN